MQLQMRWQPRCPFDQSMVEQRNAHFEGVSHACVIDFGEDVAWEVSLEIGVLHLR